jgi:CheY-like chemotaxis protein
MPEASVTVLIVDDSAAARRMVRSALLRDGVEVLEAPDGWSAVDIVTRCPPSLILQDLFLPDFDGLDLLDYLRSLPGGENLPILAFSGWISKMEQARREHLPFTDYLPKPIEMSRLRETIRLYLARSTSRSPDRDVPKAL